MTGRSSVSRRNSDAAGERHGRLIAVNRAGPDKWGAALWRFLCDCGEKNYVARIDQVRRGIIVSCGCHKKERSAGNEYSLKHGHKRRDWQSSEYTSWRNMRQRCHSPNADGYDRYGGRGIRVCDRWRDSFKTFLSDMGKKPTPRHTIGRIDRDGNYDPGNSRWESAKQQGRNRGNNRTVVYLGQEMTIAEACEKGGINRNVVDARLRLGWTPERAVTAPVKYHKPRALTVD